MGDAISSLPLPPPDHPAHPVSRKMLNAKADVDTEPGDRRDGLTYCAAVLDATESDANPLKSRFLEAAHLDLVRAGQLEVVQVRDLATESSDRALLCPAQPFLINHHLLNTNASPRNNSCHPHRVPCAWIDVRYRASLERNIINHVPPPPSVPARNPQVRPHQQLFGMVGAGVSEGEAQGRVRIKADRVRPNVPCGLSILSVTKWTQASYDAVFNGSDNPAWAYTAAKTLTEAAAWDFASARPDFDLATVLPTLLLGPFAPGHAILSTYDLSTNILLHSMLASGAPPHPVWPYFVDVRDAARAYVKALETPRLGRAPYLGSTLEKLELSYRSTPGTPKSVSHPSYDYPNSGTTGGPVDIAYAYPVRSLSPAPPSPSPSPSASPTTHPQTPGRAPRKRFVAAGTSFTWRDAITHLRTARPDLSRCRSMSPRSKGAAFAFASAEQLPLSAHTGCLGGLPTALRTWTNK
ncbi:hypothetical protein JB92DRAFT_2835124 [Gautieria morchelliformis]|nr:hypothetical protein JB92DRAFT_2835124 [Gautieria morchelliformis]